MTATRLITLWDVPESRTSWWAQRSRVWRVPVPMHPLDNPSGRFDPARSAGSWTHDRTYHEIFEIARQYEIELLPVFLLHTQGDEDGSGFHRTDPVLAGYRVDIQKFVEDFVRAAGTAPLYGVQLGNEVSYLPTFNDAPDFQRTIEFYAAYRAEALALFDRWSNAIVAGGQFGSRYRKRSRRPELNWWLGENYPEDIVLDVHGNNLTDAEFRLHLQTLAQRFPRLRVGCYEDTPRERARERAEIAQEAGAVAYSVFGRWLWDQWGSFDTSDLAVETGDGWHVRNAVAVDQASTALGENRAARSPKWARDLQAADRKLRKDLQLIASGANVPNGLQKVAIALRRYAQGEFDAMKLVPANEGRREEGPPPGAYERAVERMLTLRRAAVRVEERGLAGDWRDRAGNAHHGTPRHPHSVGGLASVIDELEDALEG